MKPDTGHEFKLPLLPWWVFCGYRCPGFLWFCICGWGLVVKDTRRHPLLFSERYGYTQGLKVGRWFVHGLRPDFPR